MGEEPCSSVQPYLATVFSEAYESVTLVEQQMFQCRFTLTKLPASFLHLLDCKQSTPRLSLAVNLA